MLVACNNTWVPYSNNPQDFKATKKGRTNRSAKQTALAQLNIQINNYQSNVVDSSFECNCRGGRKSSKDNAGTINPVYTHEGTIPAVPTANPPKPKIEIWSAAKAGVLFHVKCRRPRGSGNHMYIGKENFSINEDLIMEDSPEEFDDEELEGEEFDDEELEGEEREGEKSREGVKEQLENEILRLKNEIKISLDLLESLSKNT